MKVFTYIMLGINIALQVFIAIIMIYAIYSTYKYVSTKCNGDSIAKCVGKISKSIETDFNEGLGK